MTTSNIDELPQKAGMTTPEPALRKPLRLWPGVVAVGCSGSCGWSSHRRPEGNDFLGAWRAACGLGVIVWWVFFSRAPWSERLGAIVLMIVALAATSLVLHKSIATGMMGMMFSGLRHPGREPRPRRLGGGQPSPR